ncbi:MAG: hypothetical protein KUL77_05145 [Thermomonas sp.]|uniref:hypothetical protein n=1 Tax=Thermomonas sp. TaxID=1971895 RepID=UPI001EB691FB|nr:hypothetical protein [Thermomonas sp.]MBV2208929.1 hypothetical protein [Thermomonas sp.]
MPIVSLNAHEDRLNTLTVLLKQLYLERFRDAPIDVVNALEVDSLRQLAPFGDNALEFARAFHRRLRTDLQHPRD